MTNAEDLSPNPSLTHSNKVDDKFVAWQIYIEAYNRTNGRYKARVQEFVSSKN